MEMIFKLLLLIFASGLVECRRFDGKECNESGLSFEDIRINSFSIIGEDKDRLNSCKNKKRSSPDEGVIFSALDSDRPLSFEWTLTQNLAQAQTQTNFFQTFYEISLRAVHKNQFFSFNDEPFFKSQSFTASPRFIYKYNPNDNNDNNEYPYLPPDNLFEWTLTVCGQSNISHVNSKAFASPSKGLCANEKGFIRTALYTNQDWLNSSFIGSSSIEMNQFRFEFSLENKIIQSAAVYIATMGLSNVEINGKSLDQTRRLDPVWSTYEIRSFYTALSATSFLSPGSLNCIGVWLGAGWFSNEQYIPPSITEPSYNPPRFRLVLSIIYQDGSTSNIVSNDSWLGRQGPIIHSSIYNGELFDNRIHQHSDNNKTFSEAGFTDKYSLWLKPDIYDNVAPSTDKVMYTLAQSEPIRASADGIVIKPITMTNPAMNVYVVDFGQNFAGWARVKLSGPRGVRVTFRYAEILEHQQPNSIYNGFVYTDNLRGATAEDTFILSGVDDLYEPKFTVHGFRYVQIMGSYSPISLDDISGIIVRSWLPYTSNLSFSAPLLNTIQHAVVWGTQSNMMGVITDCPQRDERKGWMGDAGLTVDEAMSNFASANFYASFLTQIADVQSSNGAVPDTVPLTFGSSNADPNWGHALPEIVYRHYMHFGDIYIINKFYKSVKGWVDYLTSRYKSDGGLKNMYYNYGDWVPPPPATQTNIHLVSSFAYLTDVNIIISLAQVINNTQDIANYTTLYQTLSSEFHTTFYNGADYADSKQTANVLALALPKVVPDDLRPNVVKKLINDIVVTNNNHFTTGIVGIRHLFEVLANNNASDIAMNLLLQTDYPSYGFMFNNSYENATTMWEIFNAPFADAGMNSRNHHMFASIGSFLHSLTGITINHFNSDPSVVNPLTSIDDNNGLSLYNYCASSPIEIRPRWSSLYKHISTMSSERKSVYGLIHVEWERQVVEADANIFSVNVNITIPLSTCARVIFDGPHGDMIKPMSLVEWMSNTQLIEDGVLLSSKASELRGVNALSLDEHSSTISMALGSGKFHFIAKWAN